MAGGVTTYDAMMPYVTKELPAYKNDPVMVTAMREACHHDLYVLANSVAMNGVGENTTIKFVQPKLLVILKTIATIGVVGFILSLVMFILKKRKFKKSEEYTSYMVMKKKKTSHILLCNAFFRIISYCLFCFSSNNFS